jgi:hypothetical protein
MKKTAGKIASWSTTGLILYGSYLLILLTLPYFAFERNTDFLSSKQLIYHLDWWRISFYVHVFTSPVIILAGLCQFSRTLLHRYAGIHRTLGKIYIATVLFLSGPAALIMALYANGNTATKVGFTLLSCLWLLFTGIGYRKARQRDFNTHGNFLLRSYALTVSAITLRFYAYLIGEWELAIEPVTAYMILSWISWIPNLVIAEVLIGAGFIRKLNKK